MPNARILLAQSAELNHGVFTRAEALMTGLTRHEIDDDLKAGRFELIYPAVYAFAGSPKTSEFFEAAACKWAGASAALSHRSALLAHGLISWRPERIEITTTARRCHDAPVLVHRTNYLPPDHVIRMGGRPVTDIRRTLFDAGAVVPQRVVTRATESAIRDGRTSAKDLLARLIEHGGRGRRGCAKLRAALEDLHPSTKHTDTALETLILNLVWNRRLPRPQMQYRLVCKGKRRRLDFAYPDIKWNIEGDGFDEHGRRLAFDDDRERDRELEADGWLVTRITWDQADGDTGRLHDELCEIYEERRRLFFGS
jgi:very-short-patch-repair endonuclease